MKGLREIVLIHDLKKEGLSIAAIARQVGCDRKTVRKYLDQGLEMPFYGPRPSRDSFLTPYKDYLRDRVAAFPDLSGKRLLREIKELGYEGSYSTLKPYLREIRPPARTQFERRFETPPGKQAQVDFAEFTVEFTDEPGVTRKVCVRPFNRSTGSIDPYGTSPHSRWCWVTADGSGAGLWPARTFNQFYAATWPPSARWAGRRRKSCTTG